MYSERIHSNFPCFRNCESGRSKKLLRDHVLCKLEFQTMKNVRLHNISLFFVDANFVDSREHEVEYQEQCHSNQVTQIVTSKTIM